MPLPAIAGALALHTARSAVMRVIAQTAPLGVLAYESSTGGLSSGIAEKLSQAESARQAVRPGGAAASGRSSNVTAKTPNVKTRINQEVTNMRKTNRNNSKVTTPAQNSVLSTHRVNSAYMHPAGITGNDFLPDSNIQEDSHSGMFFTPIDIQPYGIPTSTNDGSYYFRVMEAELFGLMSRIRETGYKTTVTITQVREYMNTIARALQWRQFLADIVSLLKHETNLISVTQFLDQQYSDDLSAYLVQLDRGLTTLPCPQFIQHMIGNVLSASKLSEDPNAPISMFVPIGVIPYLEATGITEVDILVDQWLVDASDAGTALLSPDNAEVIRLLAKVDSIPKVQPVVIRDGIPFNRKHRNNLANLPFTTLVETSSLTFDPTEDDKKVFVMAGADTDFDDYYTVAYKDTSAVGFTVDDLIMGMGPVWNYTYNGSNIYIGSAAYWLDTNAKPFKSGWATQTMAQRGGRNWEASPSTVPAYGPETIFLEANYKALHRTIALANVALG